jgi:hypothetical protein
MSQAFARSLLASCLMVSLLPLEGCSDSQGQLGVPPKVCSTHAVNNGASELMEPGGDCIGCHGSGEGPQYAFAGTVMAASHDDTNCAGVEGAIVRITGADGNQFDLATNQAGNFFTPSSNVVFPYKAAVIRGNSSVPMRTARTAAETNCAACHTALGANGAPGRIVAP